VEADGSSQRLLADREADQAETSSTSASKDDVFLFKSPGGLMEQLNDCLQLGCSC
jgi:hypothetical protein